MDLIIPSQATFNGMRVVISHLIVDEPKLKVSDDIPLSDEFRKEINGWLSKTFGYDIKFYNMNGTIVTSKAGYEMLKRVGNTAGLNF